MEMQIGAFRRAEMFKIQMLPAGYGDCLWLEYGNPTKPTRVLIDAGTLPTYKDLRKYIVQRFGKNERRFELFIISHIDTDHIDTAVKLLNSPTLKAHYEEIWFNGWNQLIDKDRLGPQQGEFVSALIERDGLVLNKSFKGKAVVVSEKGPLPQYILPGGLKLTLLTPGYQQLSALRTVWSKVMGKAAGNSEAALQKLSGQRKYRDVLGRRKALDIEALADSETDTDHSAPNGSSIAVLAEYDKKQCLFAADSHPEVLESAIDRLLREKKTGRLELHALKVPHHGSKYNNPVTLFKKLNCQKFLISTNGKIFHHPDTEAVARIIKYGGPNAQIYFNYDTDRTRIWNEPAIKRQYRYEVTIRQEKDPVIEIEL
jgi:beta-lactamase superfamily II metal-dependent hydrolase